MSVMPAQAGIQVLNNPGRKADLIFPTANLQTPYGPTISN
jgi:hypothetical protein